MISTLSSAWSPPFHVRAQPEQRFDDALHLRSVDLHWSTGLQSPGRGRFVTAVKAPPSKFLSSRHIPGGSICVDVQRKRGIIAEPRLLSQRAAAHVQLCRHRVVETNVVLPGVSFPRWFQTFFPGGGGQTPVIRCGDESKVLERRLWSDDRM